MKHISTYEASTIAKSARNISDAMAAHGFTREFREQFILVLFKGAASDG